MLPYVLGTGDATWVQYPHIKRVLDLVNARPAAQRAEALKARYTFKAEMDADAKKFLFPQNERLNKA
jgi:GST-like protein